MLVLINRRKINTVFITAMTIVCMSLFVTKALADDFRSQLLKAADKESSGDYVRKRFLTLLKKPFDADDPKKKILIIGDSHAQDFVNMVFEGGYLKDYQIRTRHIPTACQPVFGDAAKAIAAKSKSLCAKSDSLSKAKEQIGKADNVILVANWTEWSATALPKTIEKLALSSQQQLLIVGRKNFGKVSVRKFLRMPEKKLRNFRNQVDANQEVINKIMRESLKPAIFVDTHKLICDSPLTCRVFTSDLQLISFDGGHLTKNGAKYIGNILFTKSQLSGL